MVDRRGVERFFAFAWSGEERFFWLRAATRFLGCADVRLRLRVPPVVRCNVVGLVLFMCRHHLFFVTTEGRNLVTYCAWGCYKIGEPPAGALCTGPAPRAAACPPFFFLDGIKRSTSRLNA